LRLPLKLDTVKECYDLFLPFDKNLWRSLPLKPGKAGRKLLDQHTPSGVRFLSSQFPKLFLEKNPQIFLCAFSWNLLFFSHRFTNARLEGLHSKLRAIKRRSYGFKTFRYLRIMILLAFGKLNLNVLSVG